MGLGQGIRRTALSIAVIFMGRILPPAVVAEVAPVVRLRATMPRMTGKRALMEQLCADGVRHVFGNPGTTEQGFMDILQEYPQIEFILALHEGVAVSMADAYARATRRPSFVEVHIAPGLGNALGMLHNAAIGKTPLVLYAGQSPSRAPFAARSRWRWTRPRDPCSSRCPSTRSTRRPRSRSARPPTPTGAGASTPPRWARWPSCCCERSGRC